MTAPSEYGVESVPLFQTAWDSTSMSWLQTCPRKYQYSKIFGLRSKEFAFPLQFGILFHSATETFHKVFAETEDFQASLRAAVRFCLDKGRVLDENQNPMKPQNERTRFTLTRAVIWYFDQYENDPAKVVRLSNGKAAVELSFRVPLPFKSNSSNELLWCGHIDELKLFHEEFYVSDKKTTKGSLSGDYFSGYGIDNQITGYLYGASVALPEAPTRSAIIDGVEVKVGFNRFMRGFSHRTAFQIEEWLETIEYWILEAERYAERGYWPMNRTACNNYGGCAFRRVCGRDESVREIIIEDEYEVHPWNPLQTREA